jgi:hypothetical protein
MKKNNYLKKFYYFLTSNINKLFLKLFIHIEGFALVLMQFLSLKFQFFFYKIKKIYCSFFFSTRELFLKLFQVVNHSLATSIKFIFYRNNKLSKVKIIGILLMSIILTLLYNLYIWLGLEMITFTDLFMFYFSILLVLQAIICDLPIFILKTVYKEIMELALYIQNGTPAFHASLFGLIVKLISIFFFEGNPTPYQFFYEKIKRYLNK